MSFETARRVGDFATVVLTFVDESGYPYSVRCRAGPEGEGGLVRVHIPAGVPVAAGPAGLLCHSHDQELWNQQSFTARGRIHRHSGIWVFSPESHVEGLGKSGLRGLIRMMLAGRRRADEYLRVRGLPRPAVPWEDLKAIKREVFGAGSLALLVVSVLYLANAGLGTWLAIGADLPGRPFGLRTGLSPVSDFVFGLGTALSAPLVLLLALVILNALIRRGGAIRRRAAAGLALLGTGFLVGMLVEHLGGAPPFGARSAPGRGDERQPRPSDGHRGPLSPDAVRPIRGASGPEPRGAKVNRWAPNMAWGPPRSPSCRCGLRVPLR